MPQMNDRELALEIVSLLKDGIPIAELYGMLRKLRCPVLTMELDERWSDWQLSTVHPTVPDYRHVAHSIGHQLSADENTELSQHVIAVLNAWLRELGRNGTHANGKVVGEPTLTVDEQNRLLKIKADMRKDNQLSDLPKRHPDRKDGYQRLAVTKREQAKRAEDGKGLDLYLLAKEQLEKS